MVVGDIVGHVDLKKDNCWYELSDGTVVSFHIAFQDEARRQSCMFVSDNQTWPSETAMRLGIQYKFMRNATQEEIDEFMLECGLKFRESDNA